MAMEKVLLTTRATLLREPLHVSLLLCYSLFICYLEVGDDHVDDQNETMELRDLDAGQRTGYAELQ